MATAMMVAVVWGLVLTTRTSLDQAVSLTSHAIRGEMFIDLADRVD